MRSSVPHFGRASRSATRHVHGRSPPSCLVEVELGCPSRTREGQCAAAFPLVTVLMLSPTTPSGLLVRRTRAVAAGGGVSRGRARCLLGTSSASSHRRLGHQVARHRLWPASRHQEGCAAGPKPGSVWTPGSPSPLLWEPLVWQGSGWRPGRLAQRTGRAQ